MYKIETDTPLPKNDLSRPASARTRREGAGRRPVYPFATLQPGESFAVPTDKEKSAYSASIRVAKETGFTFIHRAEGGNHTRFWRVEYGLTDYLAAVMNLRPGRVVDVPDEHAEAIQRFIETRPPSGSVFRILDQGLAGEVAIQRVR